jgi:hypothetical protein
MNIVQGHAIHPSIHPSILSFVHSFIKCFRKNVEFAWSEIAHNSGLVWSGVRSVDLLSSWLPLTSKLDILASVKSVT